MNKPLPPGFFHDDSREFTLVCEPDGTISWIDARGAALLGAAPGSRLQEFTAPEQAARLEALLSDAAGARLRDRELSLRIAGAPALVSFAAAPHGRQVALLGTLVPEQLARTLDALALETARQKDELHRRAQFLQDVNQELTESNRGIIALYAELEDKGASIQRNADVKQRLVSTVSHEFRTPIHSILGLSRLLLDGVDGPLNDEQAKQLRFIRSSAETLMALVDDLLDLSKLDAGKLTLRVNRFTIDGLLASLRGTLRPLNPAGSAVRLELEAEAGLPELETDEGKVSQILRNLISNALKFTEQGEVRLRVVRNEQGTVTFSVSDTGIGIAPEDQERIFDEFAQVDSPIQRRSKGTGLGLPLSRKLAQLLGGSLTVTSAVGQGSTFSFTLPLEHPEVIEERAIVAKSQAPDATRRPVLVVEDDRQTLFLYEKYLARAGYQVLPARTVDQARKLVDEVRPAAIVLDIMLEGDSSWRFLAEVKAHQETADIPVCVVTITNKEQKARALGADEFWLKPMDPERLLRKLAALAGRTPVEKILIIDDDPTARYLLRKMLTGTTYRLLEASSGPEGVALAQQEQPQLIFLDFHLHEITAFDVLDDLKTDARTRSIPVIINTSQKLDDEQRRRLSEGTAALISKQDLSRELAISRIREALDKAGIRPS